MKNGENKEETLRTFNKQATKEQLKEASRQPVTKFMLQFHKRPKMSGAEVRERMGGLKNQAQPAWTSHQFTLLNEMNSVAGDALEIRRISFLK